MTQAAVLSRGWIPQTADKMVVGKGDLQLEPILEKGCHDGLVVQSSLERVAVFTHNQAQLLLSDVSRMRRVKTRIQARRALVFVPKDIVIDSAVSLLATLSKIQIVPINVEDAALCLS